MSAQTPFAPGAPDSVPVRLDADAVMPSRAHPTDAGWDLVSREDVELAPHARALVGTGVAIALPPGTVGLVCPRSGLAAKHGVTVLNGPGVIDAGYRGELKVALLNTDPENTVRIAPGDRIAQLVIVPVLSSALVAAESLEDSDRNDRGFGSSGGVSADTETGKA